MTLLGFNSLHCDISKFVIHVTLPILPTKNALVLAEA